MSGTEADLGRAVPLVDPRGGVPPVVGDQPALRRVVERFRLGTGPVAVDAERASGYRYGSRAYLVQLRRAGAGTALIDPTCCPDLSSLGAAIEGAEWVLHAASQDLACLAEVGLVPRTIFDTELAGRLAGHARVGLGPMVEHVLGLTLEKGHSAADWSQRPLPEPLLRYAALDVEVLVELRDALAAELGEQGKLEWARQEFAAVLVAASRPPAPRPDPWRRTSGLHRVRGRRQLAALRSLWYARDELARERDTAPGRVLPDLALVAAALGRPRTAAELARLPGFTGREARRSIHRWWAALQQAAALPDADLPVPAPPGEGPPSSNRWQDRDPVAAARLAAVRGRLQEIAATHRLPVENLLSPDAVRRLAWLPPVPPTPDRVAAALSAAGARPWQVELTAGPLAAALAGAAAA